MDQLIKFLTFLITHFFKDIHVDEKMRPKIRIAASFILIILVLTIGFCCYSVAKFAISKSQNHAIQPTSNLVDDKPKIDIKVVIDKINDNKFHLSCNIVNNGLTEARNINKQLVVNNRLFYTSFFIQPSPFKNIPPLTTVADNVFDIPIQKDSSTIIDYTIVYFDTFNHPHNCIFKFIILHNSITTKEYFPIGKYCLDGYPKDTSFSNVMSRAVNSYVSSNIEFEFAFIKDTPILFSGRFVNHSIIDVIALKANIALHPDSISEEEIISHIGMPGNEGNISILLSNYTPLAMPLQKLPIEFYCKYP